MINIFWIFVAWDGIIAGLDEVEEKVEGKLRVKVEKYLESSLKQ